MTFVTPEGCDASSPIVEVGIYRRLTGWRTVDPTPGRRRGPDGKGADDHERGRDASCVGGGRRKDADMAMQTIDAPRVRAHVGDDVLYRVGGAMAVVGSVVAFVGNVLHPRSTDYYDDPVAWLDHNTESSVWFGSHVLILVGSIVLVGGFVALARALAGTRGEGVGQLALANALIGTTLIVITLVIDGLVVPELSDVWHAHETPTQEAALTGTILYYTIFNLLYVFMITLFGLAPIFYGVAMLLSGSFARWFGWLGILFGSTVVVSALLSMVDVSRKVLDATVWPVTATLVVAWFLAIGVQLWRRAELPAA